MGDFQNQKSLEKKSYKEGKTTAARQDQHFRNRLPRNQKEGQVETGSTTKEGKRFGKGKESKKILSFSGH